MSLVSQITALITAIGADIKSLNTNKVSVVPGKGLSFITQEYLSGEQVIPPGQATTLTHSLGAIPKIINISLICKIAEHGYAVGEEAQLSGGMLTYLTSGMHFGIQLASTSTSIKLKVASTGAGVIHMTTGVASQITPANWRLIVRAYA